MKTWRVRPVVAGFCLLMGALWGCSGAGNDDGAGGDGGGDGGGGEAAAGPTLFVLSLNDGVASFADAASLDGRAEPSTFLPAGADADMYGPRDLALDDRGTLYVASENDAAVVVYEGAFEASGAVAPTRKWQGPATRLDTPLALALDEETGDAYVVNNVANGAVDDAILVFDAATADGDVAPARSIDVDAAEFLPLQMALRDDRLYVVTQESGNATAVLVFDEASTLDGRAAPARVVRDAAWGEVLAIFVDRSDRLFAVDETARIFRYDGASSLDGDVSAAAVLDVEGAGALSAVTLGADGALYLADRSLAFLYVFEGAGFETGTADPARRFDAVGVRAPARLVIAD